MKHASTREVFAHWNERRNGRLAPERDDIEPGAIRGALGDTFILAFDPDRGHPFRVAGTRVCALFCREVKGTAFEALWSREARAEIRELVSIAAEEATGTVAAVVARARNTPINLELLLLPTYRSRWNEVRLLGVLAPMTVPAWLGATPLSGLTLGSLRHLGPFAGTSEPETRPVPRIRLRHGFVVYEGGRSAP
jgi:hypothetical protein